MVVSKAKEVSYRLSALFGNEWNGLATDGAQQVKAKKDQIEIARMDGITLGELERLGLLTLKNQEPWWQFETIMKNADAYENVQRQSESTDQTKVQR